MMKLTILGSCAASPSSIGFTSSQILQVNAASYLIDCGEGTQIQLRKNKIKFNTIEHVFISHLHGDHFFGLPGLISSLNLLGRKKPLNIYGPIGLKKAITLLLKIGQSWTNFNLIFIELDNSGPCVLLNNENIIVSTIPLKHRIYTNGFLFTKTSNSQKLIIKKVQEYNIDKTQFSGIKLGKDGVTDNGQIINNSELVEPKIPEIKYAYCSDTLFSKDFIEQIEGCDLLYHESTFLENHKELAKKTFHSTALQAATIAKNANVKKLLLGHFSSRYNNLNLFLDEAKTVFENCELAIDNKSFVI